MKKNIFLGSVDKFAKLIVYCLQKREAILWITDKFSLYDYEKGTRHLENIKICDYFDLTTIYDFIEDIKTCTIWYYEKGKGTNIYVDVINKCKKNLFCKVNLIVCNHMYIKKKTSVDVELFGGELRNNKIFIIPDLAKSGNNSIVEDIVYQVYQFRSMILSRGYSLHKYPIEVDVEGLRVYFTPLDDIVRSIIYLEKQEKKINYIFSKKHEFSIKEILDLFNKLNGYTQFIYKKVKGNERIVDSIFKEMLISYFPNLQWEFWEESVIPDNCICEKHWLEKKIERCIMKMDILPPSVNMMEKSIKSVYEKELIYYVTEKRIRTLIIINAFGAHYEAWNIFIRYLSKYFRVIVWEIPGCFGASLTESEEGLYCIDSQVEDLERVVSTEKIDKFHIIAWCSGVKAAMLYAHKYVDKVETITVISGDFAPFPGYKWKGNKFQENAELVMKIIKGRPKLLSIYLKLISESVFYSKQDESLLERVPEVWHDIFLEQYDHEEWAISFLKMCMRQYDYDISEIIQDIDIPVLIITSRYDHVASIDQSEWAFKQFCKGKMVILPIATHLVIMERAKEIFEIMKEEFQDVWK